LIVGVSFMPRAKKIQKLSEKDLKAAMASQIQYDEELLNYGTSLIDVKNDKELRMRILGSLMTYSILKYLHKEATPEKISASINPISNQLKTVVKLLENLDDLSITIIKNAEVNINSIKQINSNLSKLVCEYEDMKKNRNRKDGALRLLVNELGKIYLYFQDGNISGWRNFISTILLGASIKHPDPIEQRTRFDKLLEPKTLEELTDVPTMT